MSERTFGPYIHKYLHKQAVEDKVILDLQYEYRNVEQQLTSKEKVDQKLAALTAGRELTPEQKQWWKNVGQQWSVFIPQKNA